MINFRIYSSGFGILVLAKIKRNLAKDRFTQLEILRRVEKK